MKMKINKIIVASSSTQLNNRINEMTTEGWEQIGSHSVVVVHSQNRYAGSQHMDTNNETEYSATMQKVADNTISVDIAFYHPEDENGYVDETKKIFDEEGMREEFENKLANLIKK